jgi:serine/threonine-protein kinase
LTAINPRLVDALRNRYLLEKELGRGGMATVYLAHDLRHDRPVALKVLKPELAASVGVDRFLREIKLAARLQHPHIVPVHDSGEANGLLYYVMPYVEGDSLRHRLAEAPMLPVEEAVGIARDVAAALDYAHRHDTIHRDIKPENILLHEEHVLVADFGIGKALRAASADKLTETGMSLGTPAYMSPEQAAGEDVDGRSDLYSLGCVLYEMLLGEPPFTGLTAQAVIAKRFVQTPADVAALREGVPRPVARIVQRLLARAPVDRYASAAEVVVALSASVQAAANHAAARAPEKSIAVLPFESLSQDLDDAYFADGVTEELLNALAAIPDLRVAGRGSAFSFKGRSTDPRAVGAALQVATVLEGTIRRSGKRVRIAAQLTSTSDGYQLWSERYDRVLEDIFDLQDEIASAIARRLRVTLEQRSGAPPTSDVAAYELYLKGRALLYRRGHSVSAALECFQRATELDPQYALAWAGLADAHTASCFSSLLRPAHAMPRALDAARRALALDPELAEAHCALAEAALLYQREYLLAQREFGRALELNPNYPQARVWYGLHYLHLAAGRTEEGEDQLKGLLAIDPLSAYAHITFGQLYFFSGRAAEAVEILRRGVELDTESYLGQWSLACCLAIAGLWEEAAVEGERALAMSGRHVWSLAAMASIFAGLGKPREALAFLRELEARAMREYVQPAMLLQAAAAAGQTDAAMGYAATAVEERDPMFTMIARVWPLYNQLRRDSRFGQLIGRLNYPASPHTR